MALNEMLEILDEWLQDNTAEPTHLEDIVQLLEVIAEHLRDLEGN
jgi:hypothetical protein